MYTTVLSFLVTPHQLIFPVYLERCEIPTDLSGHGHKIITEKLGEIAGVWESDISRNNWGNKENGISLFIKRYTEHCSLKILKNSLEEE